MNENRTVTHFPSGWSPRFHPGHFVFSLFAATVAVLLSVAAICFYLDGDIGAVLALGAAITIGAIGAVWSMEAAGFRRIGLHRRIVRCDDDIHGPGIEIPAFPATLIMISAFLASTTVLVATMIYATITHAGPILLPARRVSEEAPFLACTALATAVAAAVPFLFRHNVTVRLHADVIPDANTVSSRGADVHHPLIRLLMSEPVDPADRVPHYDSRFTILAYILLSEPNTLFNLVSRMHRSPGDRLVVTRPDAVELLRPLPLRERFRAARTAKRTH